MVQIFNNVQAFKTNVFPKHAELFRKLSQGQSPEVLLVTCSDSRIQPGLLTGANPGDLFVIRNAGNVVVADADLPSGEAATIEYAVAVLGVKHIVVCGHSGCGAMAALQAGVDACPSPVIARWLKLIQSGFEAHGQEIDRQDLDALVKANVVVQLKTLERHPAVAKALDAGAVQLHGWVYDIGTGEFVACDSDGNFSPLSQSTAV